MARSSCARFVLAPEAVSASTRSQPAPFSPATWALALCPPVETLAYAWCAATRYDRWTFVEKGKPSEVWVRGTLSTSTAEVVHDWILSGHGVGPKALWDIEHDLAEGRLIELLAPFTDSPINLYAIYPTRSHLPNRVRVFIDFAVGALEAARRRAS
jgi:DNA-binding transcriptional LysR family regulator